MTYCSFHISDYDIDECVNHFNVAAGISGVYFSLIRCLDEDKFLTTLLLKLLYILLSSLCNSQLVYFVSLIRF